MKVVSPTVEHDFETVALSWPERAQAIAIIDQESYDLAAGYLADVTALEREIIEHHAPIKEAAHKAHRAACTAEKKLLDPVLAAKAIFRKLISTWDEEQEKLRLEAERKAAEEAARVEEELRLELALQAEELGASEEAKEEILATPIPIPRPVVAATFNRAAGLSTRINYRAEVFDMRALCQAVADGKVSPKLVEANMVTLNALARSLKETMNVPGVRVVRESGIIDRRR